MFENTPQSPRNLDADLPLVDNEGSETSTAPAPESPPVHTMPDKFFLGTTPSAPKGGPRKVILVLVIIVVLAALGVAAAVVLRNVINTGNTNANANTNASVSGNGNANATVNALSNLANLVVNITNRNANGNVNSNANANVNLNANVNANGNANASVTVIASKDTDSDGLTDVEEALYKTESAKSDSDGDTFLDGVELKSGYNPKGTGKLEVSTLVKSSANATYAFSVLYPAGWNARARGTDDRDTLFTAPSGDEFAEVTIQDNPANLSVTQWYQAQSPGVDPSTLTTVTSWDKRLEGIRSVDGMAIYFAKGNLVYVFSYNIGIKTTADHLATFDMIARSFSLTAIPTTNTNTTNSNANANTNANANANASNTNNANASANGNSNSSGGGY